MGMQWVCGGVTTVPTGRPYLPYLPGRPNPKRATLTMLKTLKATETLGWYGIIGVNGVNGILVFTPPPLAHRSCGSTMALVLADLLVPDPDFSATGSEKIHRARGYFRMNALA
jgi:hypothetical protein